MDNKDVKRQIGERIKLLRASREMSQRELGALIGLSDQQVRNIEFGRSAITGVKLTELGEVFGVCPSIFLRDINDPKLEDHFMAMANLLLDTVPENKARTLAAIADLLRSISAKQK